MPSINLIHAGTTITTPPPTFPITLTNEPLHPRDTASQRDHLKIILADLEKLKHEHDLLRAYEAQIVQVRQELQAFADDLRGPVASLRHLPDELLVEIFSACVHVDGPPDERPRNMVSNEWNIAHVCSRWRSVARAAPSLWTKMAVGHVTRLQKEQAKMQIELSKQMPLEVSIFQGNKGVSTVFGHPVMEFIYPTSLRWENVTLKIMINSNGLAPQLQEIQGRLPLLRRLSVILIGGNVNATWYTTQNSPNPFENAPNLTSVSFVRCHFSDLLLPFAQITSLRLSDIIMTGPRLLKFLRQWSNLVELTVDSVTFNKATPLAGEPVQFPCLRYLSVSDNDYYRILDAITLPVLRHLRLSSKRPFVGGRRIVNLLTRSTSALQYLHLDAPINTDKLPEILALTPFLLALTLNAHMIDTDVAQQLTYTPSEPYLVHKLEQLKIIANAKAAPFDDAEILTILESRRIQESTPTSRMANLQRFVYDCPGYVFAREEGLSCRLRRLVEGGLRVYFPGG